MHKTTSNWLYATLFLAYQLMIRILEDCADLKKRRNYVSQKATNK
jgi:hypothetical protein